MDITICSNQDICVTDVEAKIYIYIMFACLSIFDTTKLWMIFDTAITNVMDQYMYRMMMKKVSSGYKIKG